VTRPADLPDFSNPPLAEVVLGIHFDVPEGFYQIYASEIRKLYEDRFPVLQEHQPLTPNFETFGHQIQIGFPPIFMSGMGPIFRNPSVRSWFMSSDGNEIIQFQSDMLIRNWRRHHTTEEVPYPRFEQICDSFRQSMEDLQRFYQFKLSKDIAIRQCEISYVNHIKGNKSEALKPSEWLKFADLPADVNDFSCSFRRVILVGGHPKGRLICEATSAFDVTGEQMINLTLTARGAPETQSISATLDFLQHGRDMIVRAFAEGTTDSAHKIWGRVS
jgi:uncharacterized protein (TIGR04255 family)